MKRFIVFTAIFSFILIADDVIPQDVKYYPKKVVKAKYFDKTPPLREMKLIEPGERDRSWKDGIIKNESMEMDFDKTDGVPIDPPGAQDYFGNVPTRGPISSFEGVGNVNSVYPPDTEGDVGTDHYFQMINLSFAIYTKEGEKIYGPADNSTLWQGFIGPWTGTNDGDPVVLYDEQADRWIATQFAIHTSNGTYWELVAVSQTGDPTGEYYRYAFQMDYFNDYPKFGVWPDGYYSSYHMFYGGFLGAAFAVFERNKMLEGDSTAQMVYFGEYGNMFGVLPADLDGQEPPEDSPNYVMDIDHGAQQINLYSVSVDWDTPANSTFELETSLTPTPFSSNVDGIPQPNTGTRLDDLASMLMYRLQYRNFDTYETLLTNHTIRFSGRAAVRWYELRKEDGTWSIYQEGTYSPDYHGRWMGSIAMNGKGQIALGYSVSSSEIYPSIRYTGRSSDAPLGEMNYDEVEVVEGQGSQSGISRWGDYSCMSVDPSDDSTFWFTQEYKKSVNWGTWIVSFDFTPIKPPEVYAGADTTICVFPYFFPNATAEYYKSLQWNTLGDGTFINDDQLDAVYIIGDDDMDSMEFTLTLTAKGFEEGMDTTDSVHVVIDECTNIIKKETAIGEIKIIPNPNTGTFTYEIYAEKNNQLSIQIYSQSGRKVYDDKITSLSGVYMGEINMENASEGIYYFIVKSSFDKKVKKLIIR